MSDHRHDLDQLDNVVAGIRRAELDGRTAAAATDRVWQRIASGLERPIQGCGDYQRLIPELVAGRLAEARALLVTDHTRECLACRRALLEARSGRPAAVDPPAAAARRHPPRRTWIAAAALVALGLGLAGMAVIGNLVADRRLTATLDSAEGSLQLVEPMRSAALSPGDELRSGELLRASDGAGAQLLLADGSRVEVAPRGELALHAGLRGTTIELRRGNIIVHAADQGRGRLYVDTPDCLIAVRGTVFAVDHGMRGSRVSVLEGEVEVRRRGQTDLLEPGEQVTTNDRLEPVTIAEQIAWSAHAQEHLALLRELSLLRREIADTLEPRTPRTSSQLLAMVPADTRVYVALPNLSEGLHEARRVVEQRVAASPSLSKWWQERVVDAGIDRALDEMLDHLQPLGAAIGDEVVISVPDGALSGVGGPLVLALLDDPEGFTALLKEEVARANAMAAAPVLELLDDPARAPAPTVELVMTVSDRLFVAATDRTQLAAAARGAAPATGSFAGSTLHRRLAEAYQRGVSWVVGIDLRRVAELADSDDGAHAVLEGLGLLDTTTLVVSSSREGDHRSLDAALDFGAPRRGVADWLAEPAPLGSLDFVSPAASFAIAAVTRDPAEMLDDLLAALAAAEPGALDEIAAFEETIGVHLRDDIAAALGGEGSFALDGPVLPIPSWKLIVEVDDPETLLAALERAVAAANRQLAANGLPEVELAESSLRGRRYTILRNPRSTTELALLTVDGYLVVAPGAALIEQALGFRSSGITLPRSAMFRELLPRDGHPDCSAVIWRNLDSLLAALPEAAVDQLPPGAHALLEDGGDPGLICVYGLPDRILASGSGHGLLGGMPLLGMAGLFHAGPNASLASPDRVSSSG
jgi:ferric-dicitrate binding protein FerR (iron transport regulator)